MPNERARRTRFEVALARSAGLGTPRRRKLPRAGSTKPIERAYAKALRVFTDLARDELEPLLDMLPLLLRGADAERPTFDVGEGKRASELIREATRRMGLAMQPTQLEALAARFAADTAAFQRIQLNKQLRAALGADVFLSDRGLIAIVDSFVQENVSLIQDLVPKTYGEIEREITRAVAAGTPHRELAKTINQRFKLGEKRAALIARDQVGKFYGKVNENRQRTLGVDRFIWRTVNDERVRDDHRSLEGRIFTWANAPEGGPGAPINCRCNAEPVLDDLLG